jgi:DNA-binding FadR family transcriptional regulator
LRAWIGRVIAAGYSELSYEEHVPIMDAVRRRDVTGAEAAMDVHMQSAARRLHATLHDVLERTS